MELRTGKSGYLDLKFQSKGKGLSKRGWRKRWVTMHPLTDHCERRTIIRLQAFPDATSSRIRPQSRGNALIMYLDNVTDMRRVSTSRSHPYAFHLIEFDETEEPVVTLSGENETITQSWMSFLRAAFWPNSRIIPESLPPLGQGMFLVTIVDSEHSRRLNLFGEYILQVTHTSFRLSSAGAKGETRYEWRLRSLMRFAIVETECDADINKLFVVVGGPSALNGAGSFKFFTVDAGKVLHCIHETINEAIAARKENEVISPDPERSDALRIPVISTTPKNRTQRKESVKSFMSEPSRTPPKVSTMSRHYSLPVSNELFITEAKAELDSCSPEQNSEENKEGIYFQSGSSSSSNSRLIQFDSQSIRSGSPSPKSVRQHWRNYFPVAGQAVTADTERSNRTTSVSSSGSRDSGVMLDSNHDLASRTRVWVEESTEQSAARLSDIRESDSRRSSQSDLDQGSVEVLVHNSETCNNKESEISRSQSFNHKTMEDINSVSELRRFTVGIDSSLAREKRKKKVSDVYIDLDSILAAKAELDLKLGHKIAGDERDAASIPPPLPPFPPVLKPLRRKPAPIQEDDTDARLENENRDNLPALERRLSRHRKSGRSRKLSSTSNIYFEVGSLSDICKACSDDQSLDGGNSDNEKSGIRNRKVSNLYLDLDTVALLRSQWFQSDSCKTNYLSPPELPPREHSPGQKENIELPSSTYEPVDRYRKNLAQFLGSPSYPVRDNPPNLPERPTALRPPKKSTEPPSTVFSSIFETLTRRKKRLNSAESQSSTNLTTAKEEVQKVQSVTEWPLPSVADNNVADNELYSLSTDEEFEVIDDNVFENTNLQPFPSLIAPMNKGWYENGQIDGCENTNDGVDSGRSIDSVDSNGVTQDVEESFYMSMSGGITECDMSTATRDTDNNCLDIGPTDNIDQHENPYLVMSTPNVDEKPTPPPEADLYMNVRELCSESEA